MKKIALIHTGGTISMAEDKETGAVSPTNEHPLGNIAAFQHIEADIEEYKLANLPSPHITPSDMLAFGKTMQKMLEDSSLSGIVVTHGTDTLEETAYFLDLYLKTDKPVVITGAMRSSNEIGSDALYNLLTSIRVAVSAEAAGKGLLVVMNDEIHTARNVTKTSTSNIATFQSPQFGPIGLITKEHVLFHQRLLKQEHYHADQINCKVALLKTYSGMDKAVVEAVVESGIDGLIIEALGQGNVPKTIVPAIEKTIGRGLPVVLVSRCYQGIVQAVYSYEGGGKFLRDLGVIFTNGLTGPKARIKLLLALENTADQQELRSIFE